MHTASRPRKRLWTLGAAALLLLAVLSGCTQFNLGGGESAATATTAPTPVPPTAEITPSFIGLPPTYTPTPAQPVVLTQRPQSQPTLQPVTTVTPTPGASSANTWQGSSGQPTFGGLCVDTIGNDPCLYSAGLTQYHGEQVVRYVFENIPYPESAYVEINGVAMECITLPQYPTRIYCMGVAPARFPIKLRLGWEANGREVEVFVNQAVVDDIQRRHFFPIGAPPPPTPASSYP